MASTAPVPAPVPRIETAPPPVWKLLVHMIGFEIRYRLRRISTYVYFGIWALMMMWSVSVPDFGPVGTGKVALNGPYAITLNFVYMTAFGSLIISAIFGTAILRDFQENTYQFVFTKPVPKLAYLVGRWAGSMIVTAATFTGLIVGAWSGLIMPWADHTRLGPYSAWTVLYPFLAWTMTQTLFWAACFSP